MALLPPCRERCPRLGSASHAEPGIKRHDDACRNPALNLRCPDFLIVHSPGISNVKLCLHNFGGANYHIAICHTDSNRQRSSVDCDRALALEEAGQPSEVDIEFRPWFAYFGDPAALFQDSVDRLSRDTERTPEMALRPTSRIPGVNDQPTRDGRCPDIAHQAPSGQSLLHLPLSALA